MSRPTIAVVGASKDRKKYGNKCVRAYIQGDYEVYPVNPHADEIEGQRVYRTLSEIPAGLDRISIYLPPESTTSLLAELTSWPDTEIWFNPGSADAGVLERARNLGLIARPGCSIVDIGLSPSQFP